METYSQYLDEESIRAIKELAHCSFSSLLSPWVDIYYGRSLFEVSAISIPIGPKKYLVINNDWADTQSEALNYFSLKVRISSEPHQIAYRDDGRTNHTLLKVPFHFHLGEYVSAVKISILELKFSGEKECVEYDAGFLIELSNHKKLAIVSTESISAFIYIAQTSEDIEMLISDLHTRLVIGA